MIRKCFLLLFASFTFSHVGAAVCPNLTGMYACGLEAVMEFPIQIGQTQDSAGITTYRVEVLGEGVDVVADGVKRGVPPDYFGGGFLGTYSAACDADSMIFAVEGQFTTHSIMIVSMTMSAILTPVVRDDASFLEGNMSIDLKGQYIQDTKEFVSGGIELKLSDEGTSFSCRKMDMPSMP